MKLEIHHHYHQESAILATLGRIETHLKIIQQGQVKLMSQIDDFATKVNAAFDALDKAHDGLAADVDFLKTELATLQAASGLSAEDQAKLQAVADRAQKISDGFAALDALTTPPAAPTT